MTKKRVKLLDRVIKILGFEHPATVAIAKALEREPNKKWIDETIESLVATIERGEL